MLKETKSMSFRFELHTEEQKPLAITNATITFGKECPVYFKAFSIGTVAYLVIYTEEVEFLRMAVIDVGRWFPGMDAMPINNRLLLPDLTVEISLFLSDT